MKRMEINSENGGQSNEVKAWEYLNKLNREALPSPTMENEDKEMVDMVGRLIKQSDDYLLLYWKSTPESGAPSCMIAGAIGEMRNKGLDVSKANSLFNQGLEALNREDYIELHRITAQIFKALNEAPKVANHKYFKYGHPANWDDFCNEIPDKDYGYDIGKTDYEEKVYDSWLGEIIGGAFGGGAFEGYNHKAIKKVFGTLDSYLGTPSTVNDDITYEIAFLESFIEKGYSLTPCDIADKWLMYIPWGWTAETIALENLRKGIYPPKSGSFLNYFSEWIGAQMRGGVIGLVSPGKPKLAAELAFKDGQISHEKNGIYAECYIAVMVSLSFAENNIRNVIVEALDYIPKRSEFYAVAKEAIELCEKAQNQDYVIERINKRFADYHWVHAYPNTWIVINALWWSNGDFDKAINIARMGGLDTDCNCGVVGAIAGGLAGKEKIDKKWYKPFGDILETYNMRGNFAKMSITDLAGQTVRAVRKHWNAGF
jgi:ADP-ribosylglycohydrolase